MNYDETISFLYEQLPIFQRTGKAAYKANMDNTVILDQFFGSPHTKYKCVHVAGTNGKGSVSHMIASVLQESGYKTGLYTSPHLKSFRERIKVNGEMISEEFIVDFIDESKEIINKIKPSFFELTVAMAFNYFEYERVDVAIIEVGLGGRLDSTNIINPELSIITNIGFDHTDLLGNTLQKIGLEKAGIIKNNVPVVIGRIQDETIDIFQKTADERGSEIFFAENYYKTDFSLNTIKGKKSYTISAKGGDGYKNLELDLMGDYQSENLITVLKSIDILKDRKFKIATDHLFLGLSAVIKNTGLQGRWQTIGNNPLVIIDTGHNIDGLTWVIKQINNIAFKNLHMILGFVNDKSINELLKILPKNANYYFTKANIPRALDENVLFEMASALELNGSACQSVVDAIKLAKSKADKHDLIFIGGSTFIVAEAI